MAITAGRIVRPDTAFSNAPIGKQAKRKREKDDAHLAWLRTLPCLITGTMPVEACHVRYGDPSYGKRETGMGEKPNDSWTVPMCPDKHREQHRGDERTFWARHGIDPLRVALALYANSGDDDQGRLILSQARNAARTMLWPAGKGDTE